MILFFFFFQAEDGIRDWSVTGVQTCALPIWPRAAPGCARARARRNAPRGSARRAPVPGEIGRASCRERVYISVGAGALKKKKHVTEDTASTQTETTMES